MLPKLFPYFTYSIAAALALPMLITVPFIGMFVTLPFAHLLPLYEKLFSGNFSSDGEHIEFAFASIELKTDEAWFFYGSFFFVIGMIITLIKFISLSVPVLNNRKSFWAILVMVLGIIPAYFLIQYIL
ncbi:MAG: hypothetical protein UW75_C0056G0004 [Parcubacteria group bacterium GW2011_GWF2_44_8]|nr:MAG: hypothetical protein UW75_C0056G0004 [Parcubacteria group bacterium GW2011_GWF2_44_8]